MKKLSKYNFLRNSDMNLYKENSFGKINDKLIKPKCVVILATYVYIPEKNGLVCKKTTLLWSDRYVQSWTEWRKA